MKVAAYTLGCKVNQYDTNAMAVSYTHLVADTVMVLLPILDNFERALMADCADKAFSEGVEMIMRQLKDAMSNLGVEEIAADGQFDPEVHNAVMQVEEEGFESNLSLIHI